MRRAHSGRARISLRRPRAIGESDRSGFWYSHEKMVRQFQWSGNTLYDTGLLVGADEVDVPQQQFRTPILPPDPVPILNPRVSPAITAPGPYAAPPVFVYQYATDDQGNIVTDDQGNPIIIGETQTVWGPQLPTTPGNFGFTPYILDYATTGEIAGVADAELTDDGGLLVYSGTSQTDPPWPVGPVGLLPGALYLDGAPPGPWTIGVVPGYVRGGAPLFFGQINAAMLLATGGFPLPLTNPGQGLLQLWNDGGVIAIDDVSPVGADLVDDGGVLLYVGANQIEPFWPVGPGGLSPGALYLNGTPPGPWTIGITPGYVSAGAAVYFGRISAPALLAIGGFPMPFSNPGLGMLQLWNNNGEIAIDGG